jgi:hypothetical protein
MAFLLYPAKANLRDRGPLTLAPTKPFQFGCDLSVKLGRINHEPIMGSLEDFVNYDAGREGETCLVVHQFFSF